MTCFMVDNVALDGRIGAMGWRSHRRYESYDTDPRPMPHLAVVVPNAGLVCLDCPSRQKGIYWTRTGEPPLVTVTPSLDVSPGEERSWHGFVTNGVLIGPDVPSVLSQDAEAAENREIGEAE